MFLLTLIFAYLWEKEEKNNLSTGNIKTIDIKKYVFMFLTFLPMFIVNSCIYYVGTDYEEYFKYFQLVGPSSNWHMEWLFEEICLLLKDLGMPFQTVYFLMSFVGYSLLILCINKYTKKYTESYLLYFVYGFVYMLGFVLIRQFIAMMLIWYAFSFIKERKFLKYAVFIVIASGFHMTAFVMLPMYFILNRKLKLSLFIVGAICTLPINLNYGEVMYWLFKTFKPSYLKSNFLTKAFEIDVPYLLCFLLCIVPALLYAIRIKQEKDDITDTNRIEMNCIYIGLFISFFCAWLPIYKRFAMYFLLPAIAVVPNYMSKLKNKERYVFWAIQIAAGLFYNMRYISWWKVIPYRAFWS